MRPPPLPRLLVPVLAVVLLVVVVVAGVAWWRGPDTPLQEAVRYAPDDTQRLSWTDWAGVRGELGAGVDDASSAGEVQRFLDDAFAEDLSAVSALGESAPVLQAEYGLSPATIDWELFAQGTDGAVEVLGVGGSFDADAFADTLEELGYSPPGEDRTDGGVWRGGIDVVASIGADLTPQLQHVAVLADEGVVLTSDRPGYLGDAVSVARGDADRLEATDPVVEQVTQDGDPLAASVYTGEYTCRELAMSRADPSEEAAGEALVEQAGEVHPVTGFALARGRDGLVRVAMSFEDEARARTNADTRAQLAAGPAPGQGGDFTERFSVESAGAEGEVVVLTLRPVEGTYVLSDLGAGPVLFATC